MPLDRNIVTVQQRMLGFTQEQIIACDPVSTTLALKEMWFADV